MVAVTYDLMPAADQAAGKAASRSPVADPALRRTTRMPGADRARREAAGRVPSADRARTAATGKPWYRRLLDALIAARMEQARREAGRYAHYLPYSLDRQDDRIVKADKRSLPF